MADYRPDPKILELGPRFLRSGRAGALSASASRASSTERWAERVGLELDDDGWARAFRPLRAAAGQPRRSRWRCAITATSSACTIPRSATAAASCSRSCATSAAACSTSAPRARARRPTAARADGRLTLKGGVREVLATEMLEALGVNTSKSFALFETGEELERGDEPSPTRSAVLTRLSHGHIRIGTFQRLAFFDEADNIAAADPLLPRAPATTKPPARRCRECAAAVRPGLRARPRRSPRAISPPASSTACSTATISTSPARASTTARGASRPSGTRTSPPPISTRTGSTPSAASPRRSTGTWRSSPAAWR